MSSPPEAPPTYAQATGSSTASQQPRPAHLEVPGSTATKNGIPTATRRSMEDEHRALPVGWVRQFDTKEQHQFFVDTKATPPRSIWHHPYDDEQYLSTLSSEERERIQEEERDAKAPKADHTTDEESSPQQHSDRPSGATATTTTAEPKKTFGRKLKDKVTGTTHEQRVRERAEAAEHEREYYEAHRRFREALYQAQRTGQPQFFAKDRDGKEIYVEPPQAGYGAGYGYGAQGYGYNPYSSGVYANPNARFIRPSAPYGRPYGSGYGGGLGLPIASGLLGGFLLGGLLF